MYSTLTVLHLLVDAVFLVVAGTFAVDNRRIYDAVLRHYVRTPWEDRRGEDYVLYDAARVPPGERP